MRRVIARLDRALAAAELAAIVAGLATIFIAVLANVISRELVLPWPDLSEPAIVGMSVVAFIGSAYAVQTRSHIVVDLGDLMPMTHWRRRIAWLVDGVIVVLSVLIIVYGGELLAFVLSVDERTQILGIPIAVPVGCLVGGAALSIFHVACRPARAPRTESERHLLDVSV